MQRLIDDLLAYARINTRGKAPEATDCSLVFDEVITNLQASIQEHDARVTRGPLPVVHADRTQLVLLFQNLIGNAIKFRSEESPRVHVLSRRQERKWLFKVEDNGLGIDPKHKERIFQIFQRLHTRDKYPGTGIGLAICKRIVERHGG